MTYPPGKWRLLISPSASGAWNMAVDEVLLSAMDRSEAVPTLRLYAWEPGCLSIGYAQSCNVVDGTRLKHFGWDLVRRPSGGRAILHIDELTYAVISPHSEPRLAGGVLESYQRVASALLEALQSLGIPAQASEIPAEKNSDEQFNPVCFETPSNYELTTGGKKIIGSAQVRRKEGILQHGSLPLTGDLARITQVLQFPNESPRMEAANRLISRATTVETALGYTITWERAAQVFVEAFQNILNLDFLPEDLTASEGASANALVKSKYAHPEWTERA